MVMFVLAVVTLISMAVAVVMVLATREAWRETRAHERAAKDLESERNCWKALAATGDRTEDGFIDFHPLDHREAVRKRDINECMRIAEKRGDMHAAYIEEIRKLTSPIPGLAETGPYTLEDVDRIEAHRGKPYVRLRETVKELESLSAERDDAVARVVVLHGRMSDLEQERTEAWFAKSPETVHPATNDAKPGFGPVGDESRKARQGEALGGNPDVSGRADSGVES